MAVLVVQSALVSIRRCRPTNQCTRIAKLRFIENDWACDGALALQVVLLARNRVISSVRPLSSITA
jgi:hypothetical protein